MSRIVVTVLFLGAAASAASEAWQAFATAIGDGDARPWLVALYLLLKAGVVAAFTVFVFSRRPSRRPSRSAVAWTSCAVAMASIVLVARPGEGTGTWFVLAGDLVALVGCAFILVSVLTLRTCFGILPEVRGLVTRGPYRLVRHPVYLGEIVAFVGFVIAAPEPANAFLLITFTAAQAVRMRLEEQAIAAEFPEYGDYARHTPRVVPRLRLPATARTAGAAGALALALVAVAAAVAPPRSDAALRAPALQAPAPAAVSAGVPSFTWAPVRGAVHYEFQVAADPRFGSSALGDGRTSLRSRNTAATVTRRLADGDYFWRVRAISATEVAGRWSSTRRFEKRWASRPALLSPASGADVVYPREPLALNWSAVPHAYKYVVTVATDPTLASPVVGTANRPVETSATSYVVPDTLPDGKYYWAVTPQDARGHSGERSAVGSFNWRWPTQTNPSFADLAEDPRVIDPQFSWAPVAGAARYTVEVSPSEDFAPGSRVCCDDPTTGTSLSPRKVLPNNTYHWRVRAIDSNDNAGVWNVAAPFRKSFDEVSPEVPSTIPNLHLRDNVADPAVDLAPGAGPAPTTSHPVVVWDPVPGASSYQVQVVPFESGACNWTETSPSQYWSVKTSSTAWTPLSGAWNTRLPGGVSFPTAAQDLPREPADGAAYCVRVAARSDRDAGGREVVSGWTQLGGLGSPAFTYRTAEPGTATGPLVAAADQYLLPQTGTVTPRTPLFTWRPVAGARSYFVVVAKDPAFTQVVDVALTHIAAYAPRSSAKATTYADETTSYYWVVIPASSANGDGASSEPIQNHPQSFLKRSVAPALRGPAGGADIATQPTFRWGLAEGAREYRLQVAQDPSFAEPIDDVTTTSTAFTSSSTYPVDTVLYWRVRANDENKIGLTWSETGTFRRRLPTPAAADGNPTRVQSAPVISWLPVGGAVSYDLHVDQPDGVSRTFAMRSPSFAFSTFYGTGVFRVRLRANFPKLPFGSTPGPWSETLPFTRFMAPPDNTRAVINSSRVLASWDPSPGAHHYRIEFANNDTFNRPIEAKTTDNTSYAPDLSRPGFIGGGGLHWRVAVVDEGNNTGAWRTGTFRLPKGLVVTATGVVTRKKSGKLRVRVADSRGRGIRGVRVRVTGAGVRARTVRTRKGGTARITVRPRRGGRIVVRATKKGYRAGSVAMKVR